MIIVFLKSPYNVSKCNDYKTTDNNDPHKRAANKNLLDAMIHHSRRVHGFDDESGG
jgi:hypothetical protein